VEQQLLEWIGQFSYPAVFLGLSSTGFGAPIAEELVLLAAGILAADGRALFAAMVVVSALGVLTADTVLFRVGARLGKSVITHPRLGRVFPAARVERIRGAYERYGAWAVFAARFLPGLRMPSFLLAGSFGVTQRKFWLADGLAVAIYAPLIVTLGFVFGPAAIPWLKSWGLWALAGVVTLVTAVVLVSVVRGRRAAVASKP
jgi:membrane-associated protein